MRSDTSKADPTRATEALRNELLARNWPTSEEVGAANGVDALTHTSWARHLRKTGRLLGVWSAHEHTYRYPTFQFLPDGSLNPKTQELLRALSTNSDFGTSADIGGWRRTFWLYGATLLVADPDGSPNVPAEVFTQDPERVIEAAKRTSALDSW